MSSERDEEFENEPEYLFELLKLSLDLKITFPQEQYRTEST